MELTVVWSDKDVVKFRVKCSNGRFSGEAAVYFAHDDLIRLTETLRGFPSHTADSRNIEFGAFSPNEAGGGLRMRFHCLDSAGHTAADVWLKDDGCAALGQLESVALCIEIEAAAIDSFVDQLKGLDPNEIGAKARLATALS